MCVIPECPLRWEIQTPRAPQCVISSTGPVYRIALLQRGYVQRTSCFYSYYLCRKYKHNRIIEGCHRMARASFCVAASTCCRQNLCLKKSGGKSSRKCSFPDVMDFRSPCASSSREIPSFSTTAAISQSQLMMHHT